MKTGRPKEENAKRKTLTIRLTEDLYKKIIEYAYCVWDAVPKGIAVSVEEYI